MIKVLLVDDEQLIRSGLRNGIDWEELGCTIIGEAENGKDGLDIIMNDEPHIVISDIRMPAMNGLDCMEAARERFPSICFLFVSGHDEFSYVQKALKLGAADYILKPINMDYLKEQLIGIIKRLKSSSLKSEIEWTSRLSRVRHFLQQIIFRSRTNGPELQKEALQLDSMLEKKFFQVISFQIDHYYHHAGFEDDAGEIRKSFYRLIDIFDRDTCFPLTQSLKEFDLCLISDSRDSLLQNQKEGIRKIRESMDQHSFTITIGIGESTVHLNRLLKSFRQARESLELKFIKGDNRTIDYGELVSFKAGRKEVSWSSESKALLAAVSSGKLDEIPGLLNLIKERVSRDNDPRTFLNWVASDILLQVTNLMEERELSLEEVMEDPLSEWKKMTEYQTAEGILNRLEEVLHSVTAYLNMGKDHHSTLIQNQSVQFIRENYNRSDFSLEKAAGEACMSPSYFAVIFKEETGQTFNRYLTKLRVDKAKDLILHTNLKSYEIGPRVGYENPSYFSTVFKKATGHSPSEYRKNYS